MSQTTLNSRYSFDNFVMNDSNQSALLAALTISQEPMKYNGLMFLYGKAGSGKTHLLRAILKRFKQIHKKPALYATADEFCKDAIYAVRNKQHESFEEKYRNNYLLIIDDLQLIAGKPFTQEELLIVLKEFQIKNFPIILAADRHPYLIPNLDDILRDSCFGGLMLEIKNKNL